MRTDMEFWKEVRREVLTNELSQRAACEKFKFDREWLGFTLRTTRYGKVLDAGAPASGVQDIHLGAKWITDAELRAKPLGDRYVFALGVNNLFDTYPTNTPLGRVTDPVSGAQVNLPASRYVTPFSNFSPFGFNGRYIYGRLAVEF